MSETLEQTNITDSAVESAADLANQALELANQAADLAVQVGDSIANAPHDDFFIAGLSVLVLACFVGYYVVWHVTPALHSPLMGITNAISSVVVLGALIAVGAEGFGFSTLIGFLAIILASINIFGGFIVTQRMLAMFKKKER